MSNSTEPHTLGSLARDLELPLADVAYFLGTPPADASPDTPVSPKKAAELIKTVKAASNPQGRSQKQLASGVDKKLVAIVATDLGVTQKLVAKVFELRCQQAYDETFNLTEQALALERIRAIAHAEATKEHKKSLDSFKLNQNTQELLTTLRQLEMESISGHEAKLHTEAVLETFTGGTAEEAAILYLKQQEVREGLILAIQEDGYIPTEAELRDFFVAAAYRLRSPQQ